ncbi:MAG: aldehyde:ferredoxin oxidoreductase [Chitinivibrionales bacterium]|nr:aldehyde:ferredoxin oxidoreductase [Chitinivibrionales bacterium]
MNGFFNRILRINMNTKSFFYETIGDDILHNTLGGKGLGTYLLYNENPVNVDPFSPDALLIITVGPITGTKCWSQSRFGVFAKSPATGGYCESYCGGSLAPRIKGCGIDAVIIAGACDSLVFCIIDEAGVSFEDASLLQGSDTFSAEDAICARSRERAGAMVIGPAGENRIACACIKSDRYRSVGRGGMGAVMGSKNIKGISFAGTRKATIADEALLMEHNKALVQEYRDSPVTKKYQQRGTPAQVETTNKLQCFPTRYWQSGNFAKWRSISSDYMLENFDVKAHPCPSCFLKCTKHSIVKKGRHAGLEIDGPEFETIYAIGGLNEIDSLEEIAWLNELCDKLGIDTMSAGNLSAFAIEASKAGKIDFAIDYNQPDRTAEFYRMVAHRKGVGRVFAKGIKQAASELAMEDIAVHVKGLEPAGFDPRVLKGMGLSYAVSARGACHLRGTFYKAELSGEIDKNQVRGKAKLFIDYEDRCALFDSLILCRFYRDFILWDGLSTIIKATTGMDHSRQELARLANRITQQSRAYNLREGIDEREDRLPARLCKEANREGATVSAGDIATMVTEYNALRRSIEDEEKTQA